MPKLGDPMHIRMMDVMGDELTVPHAAQRGFATQAQIRQAIEDGRLNARLDSSNFYRISVDELKACFGNRDNLPEIYGLHWGDPEQSAQLRHVKEQYIEPYVDGNKTALEIGPGGGRWTRYMLGFGTLYVIDLFSELLDELKKNFNQPNMCFIKNSGTDLPDVPDGSVDFVFSFGTFVHLEPEDIDKYLGSIKSALRPREGVAIIQYSDKTKPGAQNNPGFSDMTPNAMRELVLGHGLSVDFEDTDVTDQSALIAFRT